MPTPLYPGSNIIMAVGTSQTLGTQSTAALQSAGYRGVLDAVAAAAGKRIKFMGSQVQGSPLTNNLHEGYSGANVATVQSSSLAARIAQQPEGIILEVGTPDFAVAATAAAVATSTTTILNDIWDRVGHVIPGTGSALRYVIVVQPIRYVFDLVTINPRIIDFNTNFLPGIVAAQVALGRDTVIIPSYAGVNVGADNIHPDDAGYTQWAQLLMVPLATRLRAAA